MKSKYHKDERLINHFAYLFTRETLIIYPDLVKENDTSHSRNFEYV